MNITGVLVAMLKPVLNNRVWVDTIPEGMTAAQRTAPFLVMQRIGGPINKYVDGTLAGDRSARAQFMMHGENRAAVDEAAELVLQRLMLAERDGFFISVQPQGEPVCGYDDVAKLRNAQFDVIIWYRNVVP